MLDGIRAGRIKQWPCFYTCEAENFHSIDELDQRLLYDPAGDDLNIRWTMKEYLDELENSSDLENVESDTLLTMLSASAVELAKNMKDERINELYDEALDEDELSHNDHHNIRNIVAKYLLMQYFEIVALLHHNPIQAYLIISHKQMLRQCKRMWQVKNDLDLRFGKTTVNDENLTLMLSAHLNETPINVKESVEEESSESEISSDDASCYSPSSTSSFTSLRSRCEPLIEYMNIDDLKCSEGNKPYAFQYDNFSDEKLPAWLKNAPKNIIRTAEYSSDVKGVSWDKSKDRWKCSMCVKGKNVCKNFKVLKNSSGEFINFEEQKKEAEKYRLYSESTGRASIQKKSCRQSPCKGVSWHAKNNAWHVQYYIRGKLQNKCFYLKDYSDEEALSKAIMFRKSIEKQLFVFQK
eukprot:GHVL01023478.1.p1 GENE.GHVL01023478.1~~GHVL01023478.1.p1  ORF type:complete len:409 (+),score=82.59 GHVL01023478.1:478-1704(+)